MTTREPSGSLVLTPGKGEASPAIYSGRNFRQHPIGRFIGDFHHVDASLVFEVDGDIHVPPVQASYDTVGLYVLDPFSRLLRMGRLRTRHPPGGRPRQKQIPEGNHTTQGEGSGPQGGRTEALEYRAADDRTDEGG